MHDMTTHVYKKYNTVNAVVYLKHMTAVHPPIPIAPYMQGIKKKKKKKRKCVLTCTVITLFHFQLETKDR